MPKRVLPLTDSQVKSAKPKDKDYNLADGDGLNLRVRTNGTKDWIFRFTVPFTSKRTAMSFGKYPVVTLSKAREQRLEALRLLQDNINPIEHKAEFMLEQKRLKSNTLKGIMEDWLKVKRTTITADHALDIERSLNSHIMEKLGNRPIHELQPMEVIETLRPLEASGKLEMVKRVSQRLNEIMTYSVNVGILRGNPLSGIKSAFKSPGETKKHLPTIKPEQLGKLLKDLNRASIKIITRALIEFQLHTMTRPSEAAGARWDEMDFENNLWIIPEERMKMTKKKKDKDEKYDHIVPLTPQVLELIEFVKPISGHREFLFPADRNPQKPINSQTANMALKRMGYEKKLVAHGLRALASTTLNEQGFNPDVIEACLAHTDSNQVRKAYNRAEYIPQRREVLEWWSAHIEQSAMQSATLSNGGTNE